MKYLYKQPLRRPRSITQNAPELDHLPEDLQRSTNQKQQLVLGPQDLGRRRYRHDRYIRISQDIRMRLRLWRALLSVRSCPGPADVRKVRTSVSNQFDLGAVLGGAHGVVLHAWTAADVA